MFFLFLFNDTATTEIYTLSLHDAFRSLTRFHPAPQARLMPLPTPGVAVPPASAAKPTHARYWVRSEEHTSELQSLTNLVCRLLLEKKNTDRVTFDSHKTGHVRARQRRR